MWAGVWDSRPGREWEMEEDSFGRRRPVIHFLRRSEEGRTVSDSTRYAHCPTKNQRKNTGEEDFSFSLSKPHILSPFPRHAYITLGKVVSKWREKGVGEMSNQGSKKDVYAMSEG